jgi:hypothetical protein
MLNTEICSLRKSRHLISFGGRLAKLFKPCSFRCIEHATCPTAVIEAGLPISLRNPPELQVLAVKAGTAPLSRLPKAACSPRRFSFFSLSSSLTLNFVGTTPLTLPFTSKLGPIHSFELSPDRLL